MEKKKKDCKLASATCQEAHETNDLLRKEDQNQSGVGPSAGKNATVGSSSEDNAPSLNQQFQPVVQWPCTSQPTAKQSPIVLKPCIPSQSVSPIGPSQWQPSQRQQPNPTTHQVQQSQTPPHLVQSAMPVWMAQRPGYQLAGASVPSSYHPLAPIGTLDVSWQGPALIGGGMSARSQPQVPSFCYHAGYPYPGFPGHWDPSSWWGQPQQSLPPCTYTFPGACGNFSSSFVPVSGCSAASAQSLQRGIIRPSLKLSQKHQQLWEAQSAENVQLWTVVGHLQSELADCKSRLMKLEADVLSQKPVVEEPAAHATGTSLTGQKSRRGRPKRPIASVDVLPSPDESRHRARGRKTAVCNAQCEDKDFNFEKGSISKVEGKEKASRSTTNIQSANDGKIATIYPNNSGEIEISGSHPAFDNQIYEDIPGLQSCGVGLDSSELKRNDSKQDTKSAFSLLFQHVKGIESKSASANFIGTSRNGNFGWPSNITPEDCGRSLLNINSQNFYSDSSVTGQGGKVVTGWSFANGEDASLGLENAMVGSPKDEDDEMEDDDISGAEDTA